MLHASITSNTQETPLGRLLYVKYKEVNFP